MKIGWFRPLYANEIDTDDFEVEKDAVDCSKCHVYLNMSIIHSETGMKRQMVLCMLTNDARMNTF